MATAALTNVALLIMLYPEVLGMVDVVIMGACCRKAAAGVGAGTLETLLLEGQFACTLTGSNSVWELIQADFWLAPGA